MEQQTTQKKKKTVYQKLDVFPVFHKYHKKYQKLRQLVTLKCVSYILLKEKKISLPQYSKKILFYPELPGPGHIIRSVCQVLGYTITNDPTDNYEFIISYEDKTTRKPSPVLDTLSLTYKMLNSKCMDISKEKVDKVHEACYGYSTIVDPFTYKGVCVEKSSKNGTHDGIVVQCPIKEKKPGKFYQRVINNQVNEQEVEDIRVPVYGDIIPFAFVKYRSVSTRFSTFNRMVKLVKPEEVLSPAEVKQILKFCRSMGIDFGELDILRDRDDNKLYIVDANPTPGGLPSSGITRLQGLNCIYLLAEAFSKSFLRKVPAERVNTVAPLVTEVHAAVKQA
ncbi:hypothetical protein ACFSKU_18750 [Pontibacter silvestris]|uniref:ATP-grasp domain-containing protein n=1 Tax=Pontibacter silvestris TaxID=2305183 RepID=A0ABW4X2U9_9BACT|nr:hypothetical protein [Pontibacter silvestris]MCC9135068.1 hypothetical protein [Pontibacter silvestris]